MDIDAAGLLLFNHIPQGFCLLEKLAQPASEKEDYIFLSVNPAFGQHTGLQNATGQTFINLFPQTGPALAAHCNRAIATGQSVIFECYLPEIDIRITAETFPVPDNRVGLMLSRTANQNDATLYPGNNDADELRLTVDTLRRSEEKYRTLFDSIDEGYCIIEMIYNEVGKATDFRYLEVNRAFAKNNGLYNAEGKTIREMAPEIELKWIEIYDQVAQTGLPVRFEEDSVALGRTFSLYAFRIGAPELRQVAVIFTDITQKHNTETALRQAEARYKAELEQQVLERTAELGASQGQLQTIFDTTLIQLCILKAIRNEANIITDLEILLVNKELEKNTGRTDLVGKRYAEEYPGIKQMGLFDIIVDTINTGMPRQLEFYYPHEGLNRWYSCMFVKLGDGVMSSNLDITDRKEAEARMQNMQANQQLEIFRETLNAQEEERRRISESLHNGLGQLLYGIKISLAGLTREEAIRNPETYLNAHKYTNKLLDDGIRECRRISHELMPAMLEEFGLKAAIDDICHQLTGGVKFICSYKGLNRRLPAYLELAIFRTVQELMLNIVKHAHATQAHTNLTVNNNDITIQVTDNGVGIQNQSTTSHGIGLGSIRSKINLLNGHMQIESNIPAGTKITVSIPYQAEQES